MHQSFFATMHGARAWLAIVAAKMALVLAAFVLLGQANAFFSLGIPVLLLHVGALAMIAVLLIWQSAHRSLGAKVNKPASDEAKTPHIGILLHSAALYDTLAWLLTYGRERAFRERMLSFAKLKPGEAVLDVGCGTGTVALLAKKKVGPEGRVDGVDASPEMVARATAKAGRARIQVGFSTAIAQQLPFKDGEFDVVLSTLMFHHLPKKGREEFIREAFRVLKPDGRVLIVDFAKPPRQKSTFRFHRHGHVDLDKVAAILDQHRFNIVEQGEVGTKGLRYLVAQPEISTTTLAAR
ncbi:class I SAM-dependent methyltransferase [Mesorhizobium sp.]|uniref:class I SAM-dependent methyltransferase n=1 Tax=Mesorhizobium sp. TaxID=1871066 RepID=UPI0025C08EAB|nr:class I SAM-dependent methyltransferase [Mesorhizobium sp.]